jgi:hypothetical protein
MHTHTLELIGKNISPLPPPPSHITRTCIELKIRAKPMEDVLPESGGIISTNENESRSKTMDSGILSLPL